MKWLRTRIPGRNRLHEETAEERPQQADAGCPRLILLVHDASGPASYQLHTFADAQSAQDFVEFWFPTRSEHGILAFWAEHQEPSRRTDSDEEIVVLVRDEDRREIVYPFSLPDMGLARAWITQEAARGLDLRLVLVYWAVPVRIGRDHWGRVRLTPREPPSSKRPQPAPPAADHAADAAEREDAARERAQASGDGPQAARIDELLDEINIAELVEEVDRVIREKRWKRQDGPFRGFGSPRGKF